MATFSVLLSSNFLCYIFCLELIPLPSETGLRIHSCSKPKNELWDLSRRWLLKREPFHFSLERCISLFSLSNASNIVSQPGNTLVAFSMVLYPSCTNSVRRPLPSCKSKLWRIFKELFAVFFSEARYLTHHSFRMLCPRIGLYISIRTRLRLRGNAPQRLKMERRCLNFGKSPSAKSTVISTK